MKMHQIMLLLRLDQMMKIGTTNGTTRAEVYYGKWDARGVQWDITPKINCSDFIACVKRKTVEYDDARSAI